MRRKNIFSFIKQAINGEHQDFTTGSIERAVFLLAIPMILEMCMESVFAVVDIFFVAKLGSDATATVGLTESVLTIIYSVAIGISMASTAIVARRVGEKNEAEASKAGAQAIMLTAALSILISITGLFFAADILRMMGATPSIIAIGTPYATIMLAGNIVIMMLFLLNGIFRGAGDASIAMKSLWIANLFNIILCPLFIHWFGLTGAAIATTTGRGIGVLYQVYRMLKGNGIIKMQVQYFKLQWQVLKNLISIASPATFQFIIASASWMFMARIIAGFGGDAVAGYTIAIRLLIFFLMPAWGLSNAAATLVGQNLGAQQPERAEKSVWATAKYNAIFMGIVSVLFFVFGEFFVRLVSHDENVIRIAAQALRITSMGYIFYGIGMVMVNAFNGAGDTKTPTWINFFGFWMFQIPLAYWLSHQLNWGPKGVFTAILLAESSITIAGIIMFKRGRWKKVKV
jgi:putative MATE family efflux protein